MFKKVLLAFCTLFCLLSALGRAEDQYENHIIDQIDVVMVNLPQGTIFDPNAVRVRMKNRIGGLFSQMDFDADLKCLAADFDRIEPEVTNVEGKIFITLKLWPKPIVRSIQWHGNSKLKTSKLQDELGVTAGTLFNRRGFNQAFHKVKAYYVSKGFFEAQLDYQVVPDADCNAVDIHITIDEGRAGRIKKINFHNFTYDERLELLEMMVTKEFNIFLSWLTDEGTYREEMIQQDELAVLNYLQNKGYADARVRIEVNEAPGCKDRIIVTVIADRGERYRFNKFIIEGNKLYCEEEIRKRFYIEEGGYYSLEDIYTTLRRVQNFYGKSGYIDTIVDFEAILIEGENAYDVILRIEEGEQHRVGLIQVFGNYWTQTNVILHETLLVPGEVFNSEKLRKTEERLLNIGYFKCVNVFAVKSEGPSILGEEYRDVHIEVEEASTGHFGASFGYSTSESIFGSLEFSENNFNSAGLRSLFTQGIRGLRGGGEFLSLKFTAGTKTRNYVLSWSKPYFLDSLWTVGFDIDRVSNRYVSNAYDIETTGFTVKGLRLINTFVRAGVHYRIKNTHLHIHDKRTAPKDLRKEARKSGLLSAVGGSWVYDSTNHPLSPTTGFKSRVEGEFAGLGGMHTFISTGYINNYYFTLPAWDCSGVWRFRADFQFILPLGSTSAEDIPMDERFFLGGDHLVRGYRPYWLGPKFKSETTKEEDPSGGISLQFLSLEYSRPLVKIAEGFLFLDAGALSNNPIGLGKIYVSTGFGVKLCIVPGGPPLILGLGFPLNPGEKHDIKRFFMSLGGRF